MNSLRESRIIRLSLLLFFAAFLLYGLFAASSLLWGPRITVPDEAIVVSEPHAVIRGATENVASITLNGTVLTTTEDGVFERQVVLTPGTNRFVLTAHDKYGRVRESAVDILYIVSPEALRPPPRTQMTTTTPE